MCNTKVLFSESNPQIKVFFFPQTGYHEMSQEGVSQDEYYITLLIPYPLPSLPNRMIFSMGGLESSQVLGEIWTKPN